MLRTSLTRVPRCGASMSNIAINCLIFFIMITLSRHMDVQIALLFNSNHQAGVHPIRLDRHWWMFLRLEFGTSSPKEVHCVLIEAVLGPQGSAISVGTCNCQIWESQGINPIRLLWPGRSTKMYFVRADWGFFEVNIFVTSQKIRTLLWSEVYVHLKN